MNRMMSSFVASLGALTSLWPATPPQRYPHGSEMEALRGDVIRVGDDMRRVIERERAELQKSQK